MPKILCSEIMATKFAVKSLFGVCSSTSFCCFHVTLQIFCDVNKSKVMYTWPLLMDRGERMTIQ